MKRANFLVLKSGPDGDFYKEKVSGVEFMNEGCRIYAYIDKRHTMHFIDPQSGVAFDGYAIPFVRGYDEEKENQILQNAQRYITWITFRNYKKTIKENQSGHAVWIKRFEEAKRWRGNDETGM